MIRKAVKEDLRRIAGIDRESAKEIRYHEDVIPETVLVSEFGARLAGVGYILRAQGPFFHLVVRVGSRSRHAADAADELFSALTGWFGTCRKRTASGPYPILRLWCRDFEDAYRAFLEEYGFQTKDRMFVMERTLDGEGERKEADVREVPLEDPEAMRAYIRLTEDAYGYADRAEEMRYRTAKAKGRVFALYREGTPVSFVTVWPFSEGTYATENVFTVREARRKGYSETLLLEIADRLKKEGAKRLRLTVYANDEPAIRLYRKIGYRTAYELIEYHL